MSILPAMRSSTFALRGEESPSSGTHSNRYLLLASVFVVLAIVPCIFPGRESFGDLPSHLYNAWLAILIKNHQAPGLTLAGQSTNVLVDRILELLLGRFGQLITARITLSFLAVVFFLGSLSWVRATSDRQGWRIWPVLLMLTHGIVLQSGFLNFYLSTGICLFALSLLWRPTILRITLAVVLFAIARIAHPLPIIWALGVLGYVRVAERLSYRTRIYLIGALAVLLFTIRSIVIWKFAGAWEAPRLLEATGASQILLHPTSFALLALLLLVLSVAFVLRDMSKDGAAVRDPIFHVYVVSVLAVILMPNNVNVGQFSSGGYISLRFSLFAAIAGTVVLGRHVRSDRFFWSTSGIAVVFFALLYRDGKAISEITSRLAAQTASLAGMPRVTALVKFPQFGIESALAKPLRLQGLRQVQKVLYDDDFGTNIAHIIDAACINHCISYGNYEPSTYQFRVRALPGNLFAATKGSIAADLEEGRYTVQNSDLPMYSIYVCGPNVSDFCIRALTAGEKNGYPVK